MPTTLKLKNSVTAAATPTTLVQGEVAINITDKKVWVGNAATTPIQIAGAGTTGNAAGSNTQVQYNSSGSFAGDADFTFDGTTVTMANDASISGLTVGKGGGAVAGNTAVGYQAINASATGANNTAVGYQAGYSNTTGASNTVVGRQALYFNTTASNNTAVGYQALYSNTTSGTNTAIGYQSLLSNTGDSSAAVGFQALYSNTTGRNQGFGTYALYTNTTGTQNNAYGDSALYLNTTGNNNTALGYASAFNNTTGANNVAIGHSALQANTTASNNTAVGYQAGYTNTTGTFNTFIGQAAGFYSNASSTAANTCIGSYAGYNLSTGVGNTFIGSGTVYQSGTAITTGSNNTIIGAYNGNINGLDIRTASNYIVLSDGDGNPRGIFDGSGNFCVGVTSSNSARIAATQSTSNNVLYLVNSNATTVYGMQIYYSGRSPNNTGEEFIYCGDTGPRFVARSNGGLANYSGNNVNLSDVREKTNIELANSYLDKICSIPVKTFNYIDQNLEEDGGLTLGVIAQDVQAVAPELIMESNWGTKEEPKMRLGIYQTDLQYALMKCIQELKAEVDSLKAQLNK